MDNISNKKIEILLSDSKKSEREYQKMIDEQLYDASDKELVLMRKV